VVSMLLKDYGGRLFMMFHIKMHRNTCSFLCRVVQKNLVFVVGLSPRLCDAEILRRHEYFGKFGKIHKVVINQSTSYVGSQVTNVGA